MSDATETAPPTVRVVSGNPTPEETAAIAVLVAALAAGGGQASDAPRRRARWSDPRRGLSSLPTGGWGRR